uniref:Cysteine rich secreted protein n=1 Tax=Riptortus pedestris TaxID=329032 RepID=R4WHR5_RIPPE|nr:cysteine rich secreted protein [Riptortus pedestris]
MARLALAVGILCIISTVLAVKTLNDDLAPETQVTKTWCDSSSFCDDGDICCRTAGPDFTCCPPGYLCCGGGTYCCATANKMFESQTTKSTAAKKLH